MHTDIFLLAKQTQGKANPITTALLYAFCPAAAYWYIRNAPIEDVFDVVWKALEDYESGKTLGECLTGYGLEILIPSVKDFIKQGEQSRRHRSYAGTAPERALITSGKQLDLTFGIQNELNKLGGSWESVKQYVHVWAFLMRDWKGNMRIRAKEGSKKKFKMFIASLSAPGVHSKQRALLPVWGWEVTVGKVTKAYLGLLVNNNKQDALRFALVYNSDLVGDKPWPNEQRPLLYALDRETGGARFMDLSVGHQYALNMVSPMHQSARIGPNIPLRMIQDQDSCNSCGFRKVCFGEKGNEFMTASLMQLLSTNERERQFIAGTARRESFVSEEKTE